MTNLMDKELKEELHIMQDLLVVLAEIQLLFLSSDSHSNFTTMNKKLGTIEDRIIESRMGRGDDGLTVITTKGNVGL